MGLDSTETNGKMPCGFDGSCVRFTRVTDILGESLLLRSLQSDVAHQAVKGGDGSFLLHIKRTDRCTFSLHQARSLSPVKNVVLSFLPNLSVCTKLELQDACREMCLSPRIGRWILQWHMQFSLAVQNSKPKLCLVRLNAADERNVGT